ncbi:hypothetical protein H310_04919 [Aphanomyces invadans]|uniref:Uncharacterized protein n=1 Tax=Aphanomyces invadans TaxID=157072 RepID=A0A024UCY2_9STRA|nr:hypothetical protein H310_04919 [Aphanomyces invadans]ETW03463.1 hypothetical protein H310_04919 [Aphanomyces invadans]|eukprot:XP_008867692.1 hypothetical protein H310_04919 [Aphanomyces invadans]
MQAITNERSWTDLVEEVALIESPCLPLSAECDHDMVNWEEVGSMFSDFLGDEPSSEQALAPIPLPDFDWSDLIAAFTTPNHMETKPMVFVTSSPSPHNTRRSKSTISTTSPNKKCPKKCSEPACWNKVRSRGYCKMHGGGKRCLFSGCDTCSVGGYYCIKHGGGKKTAMHMILVFATIPVLQYCFSCASSPVAAATGLVWPIQLA